MKRDYWYSVAMTLKKLESPEVVGRIAAQRTLRRIGARKVKTAKVPIVFENTVAGSLVGHIFEAVNGDSVYRGASYLAGKLNEKIAGENITVLSAGTDGIDGNSPAAGAIVDGTTLERAKARGLDANAHLAGFNAYPFFEALGDTLVTGPTGNNLRDLRVLLAY